MPTSAADTDLAFWARAADPEQLSPHGVLVEPGVPLDLGRRGGVTAVVHLVQPGPERFRSLERYPDARRLLLPLGDLSLRILIAGSGDPPDGIPAAFATAPGQGLLLSPGVWHAGPLPSRAGRLLEVLETPGRTVRLDRRPVGELLGPGYAAVRIRDPEGGSGPRPGLDLSSPGGVLVEAALAPKLTLALLLVEGVTIGSLPEALRDARTEAADALRRTGGKRGDLGGRFGVEGLRSLWRSLGLDPARDPPAYETFLRQILAGDLPAPGEPLDCLADVLSLACQTPVQVVDADPLASPLELRLGRSRETLEDESREPRGVEGLPVLSDPGGAFAWPRGRAARARPTEHTGTLLATLYLPPDVEKAHALRHLDAVAEGLLRWFGGRVVGRALVPDRPG